MAAFQTLCRDCLATVATQSRPVRCSACGSPRVIAHEELFELTIAHMDCDAFYASIEKRDDPALLDKPLIIGGGTRGVVSTCCYLARQFGVRSAMPMFQAKKLCPHAVVLFPNMKKYVAASGDVRALMDALTPLVEPLSIDEAFLDLSGTAALHGAPPAVVMARFAREVEQKVGITVSIGLAPNKFLAKIASDLDKPRGFAVIGRTEAATFLEPKPVSIIFGVGKVFAETLRKDGITTIGQLQAANPNDLIRRYGEAGMRLARLSRGEDARAVSPDGEMKTISSETTFDRDLADYNELSTELLALCERLSERLKAKGVAGDTVTLKLKSAGFRLRTRARQLMIPTQLANVLYETGLALLAREVDGTAFRLIGIGVSGIGAASEEDPRDLIEPRIARQAAAERAMDRVRNRFGQDAVVRGKLYQRAKARAARDKKTSEAEPK